MRVIRPDISRNEEPSSRPTLHTLAENLRCAKTQRERVRYEYPLLILTLNPRLTSIGYPMQLRGVVLSLLTHASIRHLAVRMIPLAATAPSCLAEEPAHPSSFHHSINQPTKISLSPYATAYGSPYLITTCAFGVHGC